MALETTEAPKPKAKVPVPAVATGSVMVMALQAGTYPRPGETYPVYRVKGETFPLRDADKPAKWMRVLQAGEVAALPADPAEVPQTTAPRMRPASPFPPME